MKIVYMGTPDFAVNPLHALAEAVRILFSKCTFYTK